MIKFVLAMMCTGAMCWTLERSLKHKSFYIIDEVYDWFIALTTCSALFYIIYG